MFEFPKYCQDIVDSEYPGISMKLSKAFFKDIHLLIVAARATVVRGVDLVQVHTNFEIGRRIVEQEQTGKDRAAYGKEVLRALAERLAKDFGAGFSERNLAYMRNFYLLFRERSPILQTASAKLSRSEILQTVSAKSPASADTSGLAIGKSKAAEDRVSRIDNFAVSACKIRAIGDFADSVCKISGFATGLQP